MAHPNIVFLKENSNFVSFKVIHLHNVKNYVAQSDPCMMYSVKVVSVFFSKI